MKSAADVECIVFFIIVTFLLGYFFNMLAFLPTTLVMLVEHSAECVCVCVCRDTDIGNKP